MNKVIYLDNAATSFPKAPGVARETQKCLLYYCANMGRSSHKLSRMVNEKVFEARSNLASLFNIDNPEQIAFTSNATMALNQGLKGSLKKGDHLIISSMEHNSVFRPATALKSAGVELDIARADENGEIKTENIIPLIRPNTKMVAMLHASNVTGGINDLKKTGSELRKRKILFLVDSAQSAGIVPIDVKKDFIDILCFPGHKGLLGPAGTGGIYVSEYVDISSIIQGGTGSQSESGYQPKEMPDLMESGTPNIPGIAGLNAGVLFILKHITEIYGHEDYLARMLVEDLLNMKGVTVLGRRSVKNTGIVGIKLENITPAAAAFFLDRDYGIATRAGFHCSPLACETLGVAENGSLRFSFGYFNTKNDVQKAAYAMYKILKDYSN